VSVSIEKTSNKHQGYNISILVSHYTKNVGTLHLKELLYTCVFGTINKRAGSLESYLEWLWMCMDLGTLYWKILFYK